MNGTIYRQSVAQLVLSMRLMGIPATALNTNFLTTDEQKEFIELHQLTTDEIRSHAKGETHAEEIRPLVWKPKAPQKSPVLR